MSTTLYGGFLEKEKSKSLLNLLSNWNRRYFVLERDRLSYFNGEKDIGDKPAKVIPLNSIVSVISSVANDKELLITTAERTFKLKADTHSGRDEWVKKLTDAMKTSPLLDIMANAINNDKKRQSLPNMLNIAVDRLMNDPYGMNSPVGNTTPTPLKNLDAFIKKSSVVSKPKYQSDDMDLSPKKVNSKNSNTFAITKKQIFSKVDTVAASGHPIDSSKPNTFKATEGCSPGNSFTVDMSSWDEEEEPAQLIFNKEDVQSKTRNLIFSKPIILKQNLTSPSPIVNQTKTAGVAVDPNWLDDDFDS